MERLLDYFVPEKYNLDLFIDKFHKRILGKVLVTGSPKAENIKFHTVGLTVDKASIDGKKVDFEVKDDVLTLFKVPRNDFSVEIVYHGSLNENMEGAYLSSYNHNGEQELIVATQFESHYAREAFPCIDEPAAKAVFELSITLPEESEDTILANTPIKSVVKNTTVFEPTPRMSTYLLAFVIGKFHSKTIKNKHGVEITTYCAQNQDEDSVDYANEIAAKSLEFYDDNFGIPYPLKKLDQVALPDFEAGAMENWGLVTYRESMLLVSKDATLGTKKSVALTVAHELSHQWFGDLVTMEWWDDLWLNESFASVMEYYAVDHIHPEYKIFESFFTADCCAALLRDAHEGVQSVHQEVHNPQEIATLFDGAIVYAKGARLMLMLIRLMGWQKFCKGLVDYFEKYQYKNTIGDDLWNALKPYADFDPKKLMHAFIDQPGYPVISSKNGSFKDYSQKRFLLEGEMLESNWPIPKISEDMSGHYILNLSEKEFNLRLKNFKKLSLEEKLRLLIDRDLVTQTGLQSPASLIPLILEFKNEDSASVWNKIGGIITNIRVYTEFESEEESFLRQFVLKLVDQKLSEVGITTGKNEDENIIRLRANLMSLDYFARDEERLRKLAAMYNEDYRKMDKETRSDIMCAKVYFEPEIVSDYIKRYQAIFDPDVKSDYLFTATTVKDKKQIQEVLLKLLGNTKIVKPQDQFYLFVYLYRNPLSRIDTFDWMTKNWDFIKTTGGDKTLSDYPMFTARLARTKEELKKYTEFFGPMRNDPAVSRAIKIGEQEIKARIERIAKNKASVYEALKRIVGAPDRG
ncbi:M1 family metallopeptidase [Candidatus Saccharibacteria bacterium]|nr:M1 family metallopeptidase [Candidatus Saccharibacteria bacterium]